MKKINDDVLAVLDRSKFDGNVMWLPEGQLDRKLYTEVAKVIELAGGKWNRGVKAHVFAPDVIAADQIEPVILTGEIGNQKQDFGQFDTPSTVARKVAFLAKIKPYDKVLEPSCGVGNLIIAAIEQGAQVWANEIDPKRAAVVRSIAGVVRVSTTDFLLLRPLDPAIPPDYDAVVMNPPFAKRADVRHVIHAMQFVRPGGRVVAIMSAGVLFRSDKLTLEFREKVAEWGGTIDPLPPDSFKASGTSVNTVIVSMRRPA